eukprot:scaffold31886_cov66-Attheya_sp.AAC.13
MGPSIPNPGNSILVTDPASLHIIPNQRHSDSLVIHMFIKNELGSELTFSSIASASANQVSAKSWGLHTVPSKRADSSKSHSNSICDFNWEYRADRGTSLSNTKVPFWSQRSNIVVVFVSCSPIFVLRNSI